MRRECRERFPRRRIRRKPWVNDPGMHHGTCVTHVPWCMSESLTHGGGENVPSIPGACAPAILLIWQEAHYVWLCSRRGLPWVPVFTLVTNPLWCHWSLLLTSNFANFQYQLFLLWTLYIDTCYSGSPDTNAHCLYPARNYSHLCCQSRISDFSC